MSKQKSGNSRDKAVNSAMHLFADDMTASDEQWLNEVRSSDGEFEQAFMATTHALARVEDLRDDPEIRQLIVGAKSQLVSDQEKPRSGYRFKWGVAAAILIAVAVSLNSFYTGTVPDDKNFQRYVTRIGEQKSVEFADGSVVTLNTGSELLVDIGEQYRTVILRRGEAYFDIANDPERVFSVELGEKSVSVLGTQFNIQKSADSFTLAVVEGVVAVHQKGDAALSSSRALSEQELQKVTIVDPGQRRVEAGWVVDYNLTNNRLVGEQLEDTGRYHQWRSGMLKFSNEPLYKVVKELNRYSAKKILIEDTSIMDLEIYAALRIDSIGSALIGLEQGNPIKVNRYFDRIVIVGPGEQKDSN